MPSGIFKITDIPKDKVATVVANYQLDGPLNIEEIEQPGDLWTVKATFEGPGEQEEKFSG